MTDLSSFRLDARELGELGRGLVRPECVLCGASGTVYVSHGGGGVTAIAPDGTQTDFLGMGEPAVRTNGFAIAPDGRFYCANLVPPGGAWAIDRRGGKAPLVTEVDGEPLPPTNFVGVDAAGRTWITVSTRRIPRSLAYRKDVADGYVVLLDGKGARIVADGIGYTNEAIVDQAGEWLYINETFARRTSRARIRADGSLGPRETVAEFGPGSFPDGLALDVEGGVWVVCVVSNRVIRVAPDGRQQVVLEDCDPEHVAWVETAYQAGMVDRPHLDTIRSSRLKNISSIAFGGPDRKTAYLGNLLDDRVYSFRSPVAGQKPSHWDIA